MISVVICSVDANKFARVSANYARLLSGEAYEIVGIHDAKSLAEGYNRGIEKSKGSILIFSHDDIEILTADFSEKLKNHLGRADLLGGAGTSRVVDGLWFRAGLPFTHGMVANPLKGSPGYLVTCFGIGKSIRSPEEGEQRIEALDGFFLATHRAVVERVVFDALNFDGFHGYDVDFSYAAFLAGFKLAISSDIAIIHDSEGAFDGTWEKYSRRFVGKYASTLPAPQLPGADPADNDWMGIRCGSKEEVLKCFDREARKSIADRFCRENARNADAATAKIAQPAFRMPSNLKFY